tara:strand:+ start:174 stop:1481 length:1308 start_codon:yes stop_codon:yes gene_type:complete
MKNFKYISNKIKNKTCTIGVIGLGYVGLPLSILISKKKFRVYGFDEDPKKINLLKKKKTYIDHIDKKSLNNVIKSKKLIPTRSLNDLKNVDIIIICLPTPLNHYKKPDLSFLKKASKVIKEHLLNTSKLIILESTTYPGTTDEFFVKNFSKKNLIDGKDYFMAYSPEREDPGNKKFKTETIPKVIGSNNLYSKKLITQFYSKIFKKIVPVNSNRISEATKIYENIFRSVNIALVNEMKFAFKKFDIDINDVIKASSTKPFGFMPFYPGPGLGGHCIPIDPIYFSWKSNELGFDCKFIKLAEKINSNVPVKIVNYVKKTFKKNRSKIKILIVGLAYKKNIDDYRESPSLKIIRMLKQLSFKVNYHDEFIPIITKNREYKELIGMKSIKLSKNKYQKFDLTIILTDHDYLNFKEISDFSNRIIDTRNTIKNSKKIIL